MLDNTGGDISVFVVDVIVAEIASLTAWRSSGPNFRRIQSKSRPVSLKRKVLGRKRKNAVLEAEDPEAEPEVEHAAKDVSGKRKRGRKDKSAVRAVDDEEPEPEPEMAQKTNASVPRRALEARMY
ncbi:hypothetical protein WAI453_007134 [Rhynchosporium graminicola]